VGRTEDAKGIAQFLADRGRVLSAAGYGTTVERLLSGVLSRGVATWDEAAIDPTSVAEMELLKADLLAARGQLKSAAESYAEVSKKSGVAAWTTTRAFVAEATMLQRIGERREAEKVLEQAVVPAKVPPYEEAKILHLIGSTYEVLDDFEQAEKYHRQTQVVPSTNAKALGLLGLARLLWRQGNWSEAQKTFVEAEKEAERVGEKETQLMASIFVGTCYSLQQDEHSGYLEKSIEKARASMEAARSAGMVRLEGYAMNNLADDLVRKGECEEARVLASRAEALFRDIGEPIMRGHSLGVLGKLALASGNKEEASRLAGEIVAQADDRLPASSKLRLYDAGADLFKESGHIDEAKRLLVTAISIAEDAKLDRHAERLRAWLKPLER
jgi:tetratricopeptide (TPR) repeat protein